MGPHDALTLWLAVLLAVAAVAGCMLLWSRVSGPQTVRFTTRLAMIVVCQLTAVAAAGFGVNQSGDFFASWSEVGAYFFGTGFDAGPGDVQTVGGGGSHQGGGPAIKADFKRDPSRDTYAATVTGPASHVRAKVVVWLPPEYKDPKYKDTKFPVVELFSGYPGQPTTWFGDMDVGNVLPKLVTQGQSKPFILVSPMINVDPAGRNTECTDLPGGPQAATWLTKDVRDLMTQYFRVRGGPDGWATMGYSEGGYCAVKLALAHPELFKAGVGISTTYDPTLPVVLHDPALLKANAPYELIKKAPPVSLMLTTAAQDTQDGPVSAIDKMIGLTRPPTSVTKYVLRHGAHGTVIFRAMEPEIFHWLTVQLGGEQ